MERRYIAKLLREKEPKLFYYRWTDTNGQKCISVTNVDGICLRSRQCIELISGPEYKMHSMLFGEEVDWEKRPHKKSACYFVKTGEYITEQMLNRWRAGKD